MTFKTVNPQINFPDLEKEILAWWEESGVAKKYLLKNQDSQKKFVFLDGPITANNPMGVHHAWGRTYKDLWQRYHTFLGDAQRYQNGFDCQGLWVEVEVEKDLGFKSKKDIETYGVANFVNKCKERVYKYSSIQTEQSKRLGYFMDWENSYFTMSDQNNYTIWNFLKVCWDRGWLYKGHDSVPWCPRCETAISQHEILTEDYKELTHDSVYLKLPIKDTNQSLLIWTTTPWTIPANIAVAVDAKLEYALVDDLWIAKDAVQRVLPNRPIQKTVLGKKLVGLNYSAPFDELPAVKKVASHSLFHTVVATDSRIMPINTQEGTGLVHTAVSAGEEDFKLGQKLGLPMIPVIADNADYLADFGEFSGKNAKKHPELILDFLNVGNWAFKVVRITHRYPACWRCKTELVWKVADEWYIAMDKPDETGLSLRKQMIKVAKKIHWLPQFGLDRELDWLKNMHDWLISKKNRYWGLALPIYECPSCGHFEVIGGKAELHDRAVDGWDKFDGNSPHRPWIDEVKIKCSACGQTVSRVTDVGNPWLDAGIVPFSTLPADWFPADFITESFPGQFKNWFYSLIAMSTVLAKTNPTKTVLGFATMLDSFAKPFHKSAGNAIEFVEAADKFGADVIRWICTSRDPAQNILFGQKEADETRRQFHLILWNIYNFFVTYANIAQFDPQRAVKSKNILDLWIISRLNQTIKSVSVSLNAYDASSATKCLEEFVSDLSLWYVRRSRDRVGPTSQDPKDELACLSTLHHVLVTLSITMAPFTPFMTEEIYRNLTQLESVHLASWPKIGPIDDSLLQDMKNLRKIVEQALSTRKDNSLKVRQPLASLSYSLSTRLNPNLEQLIADEVNVKQIMYIVSNELTVTLDTKLTPQLLEEGSLRDLIRSVQELRKTKNAQLTQSIHLILPQIPTNPDILASLVRQTLAKKVSTGSSLDIELL